MSIQFVVKPNCLQVFCQPLLHFDGLACAVKAAFQDRFCSSQPALHVRKPISWGIVPKTGHWNRARSFVGILMCHLEINQLQMLDSKHQAESTIKWSWYDKTQAVSLTSVPAKQSQNPGYPRSTNCRGARKSHPWAYRAHISQDVRQRPHWRKTSISKVLVKFTSKSNWSSNSMVSACYDSRETTAGWHLIWLCSSSLSPRAGASVGTCLVGSDQLLPPNIADQTFWDFKDFEWVSSLSGW